MNEPRFAVQIAHLPEELVLAVLEALEEVYAGLLFLQLTERQRAAVQGEVDRRLGVL